MTGSTASRWYSESLALYVTEPPFADLPTPLLRLRHGLMRHDGGDKTMAQVLNCVPSHGLEAELVAVELVIESGALDTKHVFNVLARLNATPPLNPCRTICACWRHRRPIRGAMTACVVMSLWWSITRRDISTELKELRLHGMADAWDELSTQDGKATDVGIQASQWLIEHLL